MDIYGLCVLSIWVWVASADRHTVFWNSSNTRFLWDDYAVEVRLNDYLDIVCPHYEDDSTSSHIVERYTLFLVEYEEYQTCKPQSKDQVRWECNKPFAPHGPEKFSEKFQRFTPFTLGKEFKEGGTYYYISKPIHHHGDSCMKLRVHVAGKATQPPATNVTLLEARIQSDEPVEELPGVLKSIAQNSSSSCISFTLLCLLLPVLLLLGL
ncbi:ephrin-A1 [Bombina bombina]|uniref:ephrin-A1 n=1 Tax=Bombina bombina TaxID=8345 RepID=UPI00235ACCD2|nr:ephrin-A1 [Bombina bombina]